MEVTDQLPDGYTYISDTGNGTYDATSGIWAVGSLEKDQNQSLEIVVASTGKRQLQQSSYDQQCQRRRQQ